MSVDFNYIIECFQAGISKVFSTWQSVGINFGSQKVSLFAILVFLMVVSVIWYCLTGSDGDD